MVGHIKGMLCESTEYNEKTRQHIPSRIPQAEGQGAESEG